MQIVELDVFEVAHGHLAWPWIALDPTHTCFAFASSGRALATRLLATRETKAGLSVIEVQAGPTFALPADLALPTVKSTVNGHRGDDGVHGFAVDGGAGLLAVTGLVADGSVVVTLDPSGEIARTRVEALAGASFVAHAVSFDRSGTRLWVSAASAEQTALLFLDARSHELFGVVRSASFPLPAAHELHVHATDDAVLLLGSCGEDGTFARVAGWSGGDPRSVASVPTALDEGGAPAGFVGFSSDGAQVHLVEAEELRTHSWPGLVQLASVPLAADFVSSYSGVVHGQRVLVDGAREESAEDENDDAPSARDAVMIFDRSGLRGHLLKPPAPAGMWVGPLGSEGLVTVESKGDPSRGRVVWLPPPGS